MALRRDSNDSRRRPAARRRRGLSRSRPAAEVHAAQRRGDRLQGPEPAAAVHLRPRQDPLAPRHRPLPEAPAAARAGGEARPRARPAALRRRALGRWPRRFCSRTSRASARPGRRSTSRPGYLRNYLVPRKLAQPATKGALEEAQRKRERAEEAEKQAAERAGETSALLSKTVLTINHRAGEDGKLFGSVTSAEIAEAIQAARGIKVDRKKIRLEEPIRETGTYMVDVEVGGGVTASVKTIVAEAKE